MEVAETAVPVEAGGPSQGEPSPELSRTNRLRTRVANRSEKRGLMVPFSLAVSRIAVGVIFAHLVIVLLPQSRQALPFATLNHGTWLGAFDRWDAAYYLAIAQHGYPSASSALSRTAFFPGYPLLITAIHGATFGLLNYLQSATMVSWAAFIGTSVVLYRLTARLFGQRVALVTTILFCWFPASLFYLSPYSEALFAFEIVLVVDLIERRKFIAGAVIAAYASTTSPESVALTIALPVSALLIGKGVTRAFTYAAISGAGIAAYMTYLWVRFGRPFEFINVQSYWRRSELFPFVGLYRNVLALQQYLIGIGPSPGSAYPTFENIRWVWLLDDTSLVLATLLMLALGVLAVVRRGNAKVARGQREGAHTPHIPISFLIVGGVIVVLAACTTISPFGRPNFASSEGEARFVSVAFPIFVAAALLLRRRITLTFGLLATTTALALLFQALYNLGFWVT